MIPVDRDHWNFHTTGPKAGSPVARCKNCVNWNKIQKRDGAHGWVEASYMRPFVLELVERCGSIRAVARLYPLHEETVRQVVHGTRMNVQKRSAGLILTALSERRKLDRKNGMNKVFGDGVKRRARMDSHLLGELQ